MIWILFILSTAYDSGNSQSQMSVEFNTKEACIAAAEEWKKRTTSYVRKSAVMCAMKGEKK